MLCIYTVDHLFKTMTFTRCPVHGHNTTRRWHPDYLCSTVHFAAERGAMYRELCLKSVQISSRRYLPDVVKQLNRKTYDSFILI